jgi:membrane protease YdiL (CAAX protease family)
VLAAPLGEEFVFRGALWERLAPLGARRQWLGTSALFALWHADPVVVTALIPTSLLLGAIRARHGLGAAVAAHAAHNLVGLLLLLDAPWRHV